ncbi:MAG: hypothetical protein ACREUT_22590 [Steroidobacteraceae bacterium]
MSAATGVKAKMLEHVSPWMPIAAVIVGVISTALLAIVGFLGRRILSQFDGLEQRIEGKVSKEELEDVERDLEDALKESERRFRYELAELKRERSARDAQLDQKLDLGFRGVHERIDSLYELQVQKVPS